MTRPRKPKLCRECETLAVVNRKGYCDECATRRLHDSYRQMHAKEGPFYDKWRASMLAYFERTEP